MPAFTASVPEDRTECIVRAQFGRGSTGEIAPSRTSMHVWADLTNTAHVLVLRPLVEAMEEDGHEVSLTARPLSHTVELLEDWGHPYVPIGHHGGASRAGKAAAAAGRTMRLIRFGRGRRFDCAIAHGSTDLPAACLALRIPNTTMLDYEWATLQHGVNCRLASRVLAPDAIPAERLARLGATPPKLVPYPGLKEQYYLSGFEPREGVLHQLGIERDRILSVVRTAPSYALYLRGAEEGMLARVLRRLSETDGVQTVVLPRTLDEAERIASLALARVTVPRRAVDGRSLVAFADVLISGGGTMNREAAVLGTPAWSIFEGRLGAVDEMLIRKGRLHMLRDPEEIELDKKPPGSVANRVRREPRDLLRLALPWLSERAP
jgi:predicted glycosyltransferase